MVPVISILAPGDTLAWITRLDHGEAQQAFSAIERSHALSLEYQSSACLTARTHRRHEPDRNHGAAQQIRIDEQSYAIKRLVAIVPELRLANLAPPQLRLFALVLALIREPAWTRSSQLVLALIALERAGVPGGVMPAAEDWPSVTGGAPSTRDISGSPSPAKGEAYKAVDLTAVRLFPIPLPREAKGDEVMNGTLEPEPSTKRKELQSMSHNPHPNPLLRFRAPVVPEGKAISGYSQLPGGAVKPAAENERALEMVPASRVSTRFGGIFYLLNAALAMRLYSDFSAPRGPNLKLSPWDWLALIGREWFGREFVRDPVWRLLAGLAGRKRRPLRRPRWLTAQIESLLARLALALSERPSADTPGLVCAHRAEIAATASRVDVHLALAGLPLVLRIAGLDRDPGWIPAAGRDVRFHFD
jgi:hypothetical protein